LKKLIDKQGLTQSVQKHQNKIGTLVSNAVKNLGFTHQERLKNKNKFLSGLRYEGVVTAKYTAIAEDVMAQIESGELTVTAKQKKAIATFKKQIERLVTDQGWQDEHNKNLPEERVNIALKHIVAENLPELFEIQYVIGDKSKVYDIIELQMYGQLGQAEVAHLPEKFFIGVQDALASESPLPKTLERSLQLVGEYLEAYFDKLDKDHDAGYAQRITNIREQTALSQSQIIIARSVNSL
jgi:hypothetical protein